MKIYISSDQEGVSGIATRSRDGVDRLDGRTTLYVSDSVKDVYKAFYAQTRLQRGRLI